MSSRETMDAHPISRTKVEQHRHARAAFFAMMDYQTDGDDRALERAGTSDPGRLAISMMDRDPHQLLALLAEGDDDCS